MSSMNDPLGTIEESGMSDTMFSEPPSRGSFNGQDSPETGMDHHNNHIVYDLEENDFEVEEFTYEGSPSPVRRLSEGEDGEEDFRYAVSPTSADIEPNVRPLLTTDVMPPPLQPSVAQLEAIFAAASSGDLPQLRQLFEGALSQTETAAFSLANDASPLTGLTALHGAASRGHLSVVRWLIEECGAMSDMEDKEGETALHKAALKGHINLIEYLLSLPVGKADVHAQDADGWTPLHNACSKGYLDIVKYLCEKGDAAGIIPSQVNTLPTRGVDQKSSGGWTPLMNAASKGHLPVVLYLLSKQNANPLIRNNWGETAYDIAAAVFEIWICEILQKAEADQWYGETYNSLAVHTTIPLIIHENQRLDTRFKTLAVSGGRPKFSASGLGRRGRRGPFELKLPTGSEGNKNVISAWRSDVQLPLIGDPFQVPKPKATRESHTREGSERSHFWLSDWTLDSTHPRVDVHEGWQYAKSFDIPDELWSAEMPPALERALLGYGVLTPAVAGTSSGSRQADQGSSSQLSWVRRRRWVRVMRRRLDIPPLPFLQPDGSMYQIDDTGNLVPYVQDVAFDPEGGQELGVVRQSPYLHLTDDYVARARYLTGVLRGTDADSRDGALSGNELRKYIAKLERATLELREGMLGDDDMDRKTQAEVLLNAYSRELERQKAAVGPGSLFQVEDGNDFRDDDDDSEGSFHYPDSADASTRAPSVRSYSIDYFSQPSTSRASMDLTPQLLQAPEFRVPTHESPQNILTPRATPMPHSIEAQWERDEAVSNCRACNRRFTFLFRKHCRRCGRIFCDRCSSYRAVLDPEIVVRDPASVDTISNSMHRVCSSCHEIVSANIPGKFQGIHSASLERIVVTQDHLAVPNIARGEVSSQISDLAECPVCGQNLADLDGVLAQEAHVKVCLEGPRDSSIAQQPVKYLVYKLPGESALIGVECVICLEEFVKGTHVARLSCLCSFHNTCLSAWLKRGKGCPCHSR